MEREGFFWCITFVQEVMELTIGIISTDRHVSIKKLMKTHQPNILHQFDAWHVAKTIIKEIGRKATKKGIR